MPDLRSHKKFAPTVINVSMVTLPSPGPPADANAPIGVTSQPEKPAPEPQKIPEPPVKPKPEKPTVRKPAKTASPAPQKKKPKPKKSLKKKTFKPRRVVKRAIRRIEKQVEASQRSPLQDAFAKLRQSVAKQAVQQQTTKGKSTGVSGRQAGIPGGTGTAGGRAAELIDIYRVNIAIQIQQNWAFPDQLAGRGKNLQASLVFKVFPNGEIRDVFFTDRSGNRYLDESAYKAIMKSNPVKPHPPGVNAPYVQVGLRFTPEGIR